MSIILHRAEAGTELLWNNMKPYVITTCVIFGLLTLAHIWRVIAEGTRLASEPWYVLITIASAALCLWGLRLLSRWPRP